MTGKEPARVAEKERRAERAHAQGNPITIDTLDSMALGKRTSADCATEAGGKGSRAHSHARGSLTPTLALAIKTNPNPRPTLRLP